MTGDSCASDADKARIGGCKIYDSKEHTAIIIGGYSAFGIIDFAVAIQQWLILHANLLPLMSSTLPPASQQNPSL